MKRAYLRLLIKFNRFMKFLEFVENERMKCMTFTGQGKV